LAVLLLNLLAGHATISGQFAAITISYIPKSSMLLCLHLLLTVAVLPSRINRGGQQSTGFDF
jgi:hypothetical protein